VNTFVLFFGWFNFVLTVLQSFNNYQVT